MAAAATEHQAAQATLVAALLRALAHVWALLDVHDLKGTLPTFEAGVAALVNQYGAASASVAADFYESERAAAGVGGTFRAVPAPAPDLAQVTEGVRWATKGLWGAEPDLSAAQTLVGGAAEKYVLDTGRATVIGAVQSDRKAKGWARVVEPGACSFCLLLATRGAVYRSNTVDFLAHDHCRCHAEPVFNAYEPSAEIRRAEQLYQSVKRTRGGPEAVRNAFRKAVEAERS